MADQTIALTLEQITAIFNAGCQRGADEATAFEWGSPANGERDKDLADALCETLNDGIPWGEPGHIEYGAIADVWQRILARPKANGGPHE